MSILELLRLRRKASSASVAKERLQIILAHERAQIKSNVDLQKLKEEILAVIKRYVEIDQQQVQVNFQNQGSVSVLELNVTLPEAEKARQVDLEMAE